jgi:nucleoside-diphosphate-sugar epimerase
VRILLTGASGFVGSHVLRRCHERGFSVAALLRPGGERRRLREAGGTVVEIDGDLGTAEAARPPIEAFAPDVVLHLAWDGVSNTLRNDPRQLRHNPAAALALVDAAAAAGARAWVGLGSQAEYGRVEGRIDERQATHPTSLYGIAKLATGLASAVRCDEQGLRFAWLRLFSTYGPDDNPGWLIPSVADELLAGRTPRLTAGTQRWDYLYVGDVADALVAAAENVAVSGVYNLGSGEPRTVRSIVEAVRDRAAPGHALDFGAVPFRPDQVMHLEADTTRLRRDAGWQPRVSFDAGISETVGWLRERRARSIG